MKTPLIAHRPGCSLLSSQRGAALLVMMLMVLTVTAAVLLKGLSQRNERLRQQAATTQALAKAKEVLVGFALTYGDLFPTGNGPGHFPCPDTDLPAFDAGGNTISPYGMANAPCGPNAIGRLPHSFTLPSGSRMPLADHDDKLDQQFWYAVSTPFLANAAGGISTVANSTTLGTLSLDGQSDIVAVLIAPGPPLAGQGRPSTAAGNYLEAGNAGGTGFVTGSPANPDQFNDRVVALRRNELMRLLTVRIAEEMKKYLDASHLTNGAYPADQSAFATAFAGAPAWLAANNWPDPTVTTYTRITGDRATMVFSGCGITFTLNFGGAVSRSQPNC